MRIVIYIKFYHPILKVRWSSNEKFLLRTIKDAWWCIEDIIAEFTEAGWELVEKRLVEPEDEQSS